ncbi:MAG: gamma-glutamylcyclotransferase family protein [Acidimicrobiales bacterium]
MAEDAPPAQPDRAPDLLVVYGTLRSGTGWRERLGVADRIDSVGPCVLAGSLFELDWYPGLVLDGDGPVVAEVLRLLDPSVLEVFDRFEGYDPTRPDAGEYRRLTIEVASAGGPVSAWVYELRHPPRGRPRVVGGDWSAHTQGRTMRPG